MRICKQVYSQHSVWRIYRLWIGFGKDRVNFVHSSSYGAMLWIRDENSVENTRMFYLLWAVLVQLRVSHDNTAEGAQELGRRHSGDSWPQVTMGIFTPKGVVLSSESWEKKEEGGTFVVMAFAFPSYQHTWQSPAFLGWLNTRLSMGSSKESTVSLCLCTQVPFLLNCLYLKTQIFSL